MTDIGPQAGVASCRLVRNMSFTCPSHSVPYRITYQSCESGNMSITV